MNIKPAMAASLAISAFLFVSSLVCIFIQPDLEKLTPIWLISLLASILLIIVSYLSLWTSSLKKAPFLALDALICAAILFLIYSGTFHVGFVIRRPLGVGASFDYSFILPLLIFFCQLAVHKGCS